MNNRQELDVPTWGMSLAKLEDFIRRARAAGHNAFDVTAQRGYYDDIDGYRFDSTYEPSVAFEESKTEPKSI